VQSRCRCGEPPPPRRPARAPPPSSSLPRPRLPTCHLPPGRPGRWRAVPPPTSRREEDPRFVLTTITPGRALPRPRPRPRRSSKAPLLPDATELAPRTDPVWYQVVCPRRDVIRHRLPVLIVNRHNSALETAWTWKGTIAKPARFAGPPCPGAAARPRRFFGRLRFWKTPGIPRRFGSRKTNRVRRRPARMASSGIHTGFRWSALTYSPHSFPPMRPRPVSVRRNAQSVLGPTNGDRAGHCNSRNSAEDHGVPEHGEMIVAPYLVPKRDAMKARGARPGHGPPTQAAKAQPVATGPDSTFNHRSPGKPFRPVSLQPTVWFCFESPSVRWHRWWTAMAENSPPLFAKPRSLGTSPPCFLNLRTINKKKFGARNPSANTGHRRRGAVGRLRESIR